MNATEYLEQVKKIDILIENNRHERQRWFARANSIGPSYSEETPSHGTSDPHKLSNAIATYSDIDREIAELELKREAIIHTIGRLPSDECSVIYKLYVQYKDYPTIKDVAYDKHMSYDWVKKRKSNALRLLQEILDKD